MIKEWLKVVGWTFVWSCVGMLAVITLLMACALIGWLASNFPMVFLFTGLLAGVSGVSWYFMWRKYIWYPRQVKMWNERGWRPTDDPDWMMR